MEKVVFPFEKRKSRVFASVSRPVARVDFWSNLSGNWVEILMLVDSGADYSLLPKFYAQNLGIDLKKDCKKFNTSGIGGEEQVYLLEKQKVKLGAWQLKVPVGFLERDNIPPLLGRQEFLERFKVTFFRHKTYFSSLQVN